MRVKTIEWKEKHAKNHFCFEFIRFWYQPDHVNGNVRAYVKFNLLYLRFWFFFAYIYPTTLLLLCCNIYMNLRYSVQCAISFDWLEFVSGIMYICFYALGKIYSVSADHKLLPFSLIFTHFENPHIQSSLVRSFIPSIAVAVEFTIFTIHCMLRKYN